MQTDTNTGPGNNEGLVATAHNDGGNQTNNSISIWTEEELAVLAMLVTGGAFPTINPALITGLDEEVSEAVITAIMRSLLARSILKPFEEEPKLGEATTRITELALKPDVVITAEWIGAGSYRTTWFGITGPEMCRIDILESGLRSIELGPSSGLIQSICDFAGLDTSVVPNTDPVTEASSNITTVDYATIMDPECPVRLVQAQSVWTSDQTRHGVVTSFLVLDGHGRMVHEAPPDPTPMPTISMGDIGLLGPEATIPLSWTLEPSGTAAVLTELQNLVPGPLQHGQTAGV